MSLTAKVLVIPAMAVVAYALLDSAIQSRTLMPSFYQLELREARRDVYRSTSVFRHERESLGRTTADWAAWDDTYQFVADPCEEYVTSNLVPATYIDNGLNAILLFDPNGRRVAGEVYDLKAGEPVTIAQCPADGVSLDSPLMDLGPDGAGTTGILATDLGPMLFATRPILRSDNSGPPRGVFVMGYVLTPGRLAELGQRSLSDVQYWAADRGPELPLADQSVLARAPTPTEPLIVEQSDRLLYAYATVPEITGRPAVLARVDVPRDITAEGLTSLRHARLSLMAAGGTVLVAVLVLLEVSVLRPIRRLTGHMVSVGRGGQEPAELDTDRRDEIGQLSRQYATMLHRLDQARQELLDHQHRLREMALEIGRAEELQRRRISAGLHDRIGQTLFAAKAQVEALRDRSPEADTAARLGRLYALLDEVMRDIWSLTFDLCPPMLYEVGLTAALESLLERMQSRTGLSCELVERDGGLPEPLDETLRGLLFQVVRELLANIEKHADARNVTVRLLGGDGVYLEIEDDGVGFSPALVRPEGNAVGGFGLFSVRERLRCLGGAMEIDSSPGKGTRIVLTVPPEKDGELGKECHEHPNSTR